MKISIAFAIKSLSKKITLRESGMEKSKTKTNPVYLLGRNTEKDPKEQPVPSLFFSL